MGNKVPKSSSNGSKTSKPESTTVEAEEDAPFDMNKLNLLRGMYLSKITSALEKNQREEAKSLMRKFIEESSSSLIQLPRNVSDQLRSFKWFNTAGEALTFEDKLKGKVVLLDFWTYCCINCLHVLPDLEYLEEKYKDAPFFVVGVHSAKFDNEKDDDNIRDAVIRNGIHHAVCNDSEMMFWRLLSLRSWPSFVLIGPQSEIVFSIQGEGRREILDLAIECTLEYYEQDAAGRAKFLNKDAPFPLTIETPAPRKMQQLLSYPGKIFAYHSHLFISDTNNHRILIAKYGIDRSGGQLTTVKANVIAIIGGSGRRGFRDGSSKKCRFNRPQGLVFDSESKNLFVADTENHAIRQVTLPDFPRVDTATIDVTTLLGTGKQVQNYKAELNEAGECGLSSPWDLLLTGKSKKRRLVIAMAGTHQIWSYNFSKQRASVLSGTGQERRQDTTESDQSASAAFAQPSGLCIHPKGHSILVADSESSSVREVKLADGHTTTFVGGGDDPDDLFQYGDVDETGAAARLQHPLAMTFLDGSEEDSPTVIIADTYNHKLKRAEWSSAAVTAWELKHHVISGEEQINLSEPSGLALDSVENLLFVADTNNSLIRAVDIPSGTIHIVNITEATQEPSKPPSNSSTPNAKPLIVSKDRARILDARRLQINPKDGIKLELLAPSRNHFTEGAPTRCQLVAPKDDQPELISAVIRLTAQEPTDDCRTMNASISLSSNKFEQKRLKTEIQIIAYICSDEDGLCSQMEVIAPLQVTQNDDENQAAVLSLQL